jgi:hypothetical protein
MAERPLLLLPQPSVAGKSKRPKPGPGPQVPSRQRQAERLGPRIEELEEALEAKRVSMQASTIDLQPEEVLVLETVGSVEEFHKAVQRVEGLDFLSEFDQMSIPPDDDFFVEKKGARSDKELKGRVYLVFTNQEAYRQLLNLWRHWQDGNDLPHGKTKWRDVFSHLRSIRFWNAADRLEDTGILADWKERLSWKQTSLPCEIELFYRRTPAERLAAATRVRKAVEQAEGYVHHESIIPEIHYHALSVTLPIQAAERLLEGQHDLQLIQLENIQFLRASGQMMARCPSQSSATLSEFLPLPLPDPSAEPWVALLDGLPLEQHRLLAGRLRVDDPDELSSEYPANERRHGTAMASLIIWGDLHRPGDAISNPLYVRPILRPFNQQLSSNELQEERVADDVLIVDLIHRAVRRIFAGEGAEPPAAPSVKLINLSIGITDRPFLNTLSPLARLIDWLAWKYQVLFIVSAGNTVDPIQLDTPWCNYRNQPLQELQQTTLKLIAADTRNRRLLSPAETVNGLTVAATHHDEGEPTSWAAWLDATPAGFPSPYNCHGPGYRRALKPDLLAPGGRAVLKEPVLDSAQALRIVRHDNAPGQRVALPGAKSGDLLASANTIGTSNAAALMTRAAALLLPVLDALRSSTENQLSALHEVPDALWVKTLLAHSARWGDAGTYFSKLFPSTNHANLKFQLGRFLGCGLVHTDPILECSNTRVTALSGGTLAKDGGSLHAFPLPPSLSGKRGWRSLVVTLSWFSPIHPHRERWRRAHLWFEPPSSKMKIGSKDLLRRLGPDDKSVQRGTLQHEVFEGDKAAAFVDGDSIIVHVSCREDAGPLTESIPYALAITLEVDPAIGEIYAEVRDRIQIRERVEAKS